MVLQLTLELNLHCKMSKRAGVGSRKIALSERTDENRVGNICLINTGVVRWPVSVVSLTLSGIN